MVKSNALRLDSIFHALSDSTRRAILQDVAAVSKTVGEIARPYAMSLAAVSKHLKVLESAEQWLTFYDKFWTTQLDALQTHLEGDNNGDNNNG